MSIKIVKLNNIFFIIITIELRLNGVYIISKGGLMDRKAIFETYGKYYDVIQEVGKWPFLSFPTVEKVFKNKSLIQSVYKDMKAIEFRGTATEYICWLSMVFVIDSLKKETDFGEDFLKWTLLVIDNFKKYRPDSKNLLRYWAYHEHFTSSFRAQIVGLPYPSSGTVEDDWADDTESVKKEMRADAALSAFAELVIYEDAAGKERHDYSELVDFVKKLATAKV